MIATDDPTSWPPGPGHVASRLRAGEDAASPLGPAATWPAPLRAAVEICLDAGLPMAVLWGPELRVVPNDALAAMHPPDAPFPLGAAYAELQPQARAAHRDALARLLATGEPQLLAGFWPDDPRGDAVDPGGPFACSPLRDAGGAVAGVLACAVAAPARASLARLVKALRDPLAPLRSALELLRMSRDGVEVALVHELLDRQVQALVRTIDGVLDARDAAGLPDAGAAAAAPPPPRPAWSPRRVPGRRVSLEDDEAGGAPPDASLTIEIEGDDDAGRDPVHDVDGASDTAHADGDTDDGVVDDLSGLSLARQVLVVDDHRDAADSLALLLAHLGAEVRVAYDGETALAALADWHPEAVLLDLEMPGMDGFEVARRIRAMAGHEDVPVIALTGRGEGTDLQRTRAAGIEHHLVKPVRLDVLVAVLAALDGDVEAADDATRH